MALRDKLRDRVQPFLEPGEQIQVVYTGQTGPNPLWVLVTYLVLFFGSKYRIVAVTDRHIRVFSASIWMPAKPKEQLAVLPRATRVGPGSGLWEKTVLGSEEVWVHKRFHKDLDQADGVPAS